MACEESRCILSINPAKQFEEINVAVNIIEGVYGYIGK
jgi:hypothetical protein